MSKIAIITDVNAGLDYITPKMDIPTLRSVINFGDEHYIDGIDIHADEFYEKLQKTTIIPSTSAPTVGEAMDMLEELIKKGYTDVIMYSISYKLSSIGQMVETIREEEKEIASKINIHVVDTKAAAYMQGYIVVRAQEMALNGSSVEEIMAYSNYLIENSHAYFIVDNLKFLVKNGRLSGFSGFVGTILQIKPILHLDKEGYIKPYEKQKTHRKAVERAMELVYEEIKDAKKVKLFIFHTVRYDDAVKLKEYYEKKCTNLYESVDIHMVTPAVGAHIGCGILSIGYFILEK